MTKLDRELSWLSDYLEASKNISFDAKKLVRIRAKKPVEGLEVLQQAHGEITKLGGGKYGMYLYTEYQHIYRYRGEVRVRLKRYSKLDTLGFLAHELAHIREWDHTVEHKRLELRYYSLFLGILRESGYRSEEAEGERSFKNPCRRG